MKPPEDCDSLTEIRSEIDAIDRQMIRLLGQRFAYVKAAARFKTNAASIQASERIETLLQQRRLWAEAEGLNPDMIETLYQDLVNSFIAEEMLYWQSQRVLKRDLG
jgi:isochorismate pyruvate lyase